MYKNDQELMYMSEKVNMKNMYMYVFLAFVAVTFNCLIVVDCCATDYYTVTIKSSGSITYSNPWLPWFEVLASFLTPLIVGIVGFVLRNLVLDYVRDQRQKRKDGESRTPVVVHCRAAGAQKD
jgi:hypothetical protein